MKQSTCDNGALVETKVSLGHTFEAPKQTARNSHESSARTERKGLGTERQHVRNYKQIMGIDLATLNNVGANMIFEEEKQESLETPQKKKNKEPESYPDFLSTTVDINSLRPLVVRRRTGFEDLCQLLSFASVVCAGDLELLVATSTLAKNVSWLEEWLLYFEWGYGRSRLRWEDLADDYHINWRTAKAILLSKLQLVNRARTRWPSYATHEEDKHF